MVRVLAIAAVLWASGAWARETMRISMGLYPEATVSARGLQLGSDSEEASFQPVSGAKAHLKASGEKLLWDGAIVSAGTLRFRAEGEQTLQVAGMSVRGDLVALVSKGQLLLINVIPLEDYLMGVLGGEMPRTFPLEALKAQAVAARTYALFRKIQTYGQPFHLGSGVLSQVYVGLKAEAPRTRQAVEATRGEVLTYELAPIEAYFHASCGGRTESGREALSRDLPYLQPVDCPCGELPASHWALQLPLSEAPGLEILSRSETGRATRVQLAPGRALDAVRFRERIGYTRLKSLSFEVSRGPIGYRLTGRGFGHGAGLCQWGAKALADQGRNYQEILAHYYEGTELQRLY